MLLFNKFPDIYYTGINRANIGFDTSMLSDFYSGISTKAMFIQAEYPFEISTPGSNIAISRYALGGPAHTKKNVNSIKETVDTLVRDFERLLINTVEKCYITWIEELSKTEYCTYTFEIVDFTCHPVIFATKYSDEVVKLKEYVESNISKIS